LAHIAPLPVEGDNFPWGVLTNEGFNLTVTRWLAFSSAARADLAKRGCAISLTMARVGSSSFLDSFRVIPHDDTQYEATAVSFCTLRALTSGVIAQKIAREKEPCKAEVK
jgi:hypothetical protein